MAYVVNCQQKWFVRGACKAVSVWIIITVGSRWRICFLFLFFHFIPWQADLPGVSFRSLCHAPRSWSCMPSTTHAGFEPPLRCVRVSSVSCQAQRFVARMTMAFPYPLKVTARRSLHQNPRLFHTAGAFHVLLPAGEIASFRCSSAVLHLGRLSAARLQRWGWEQRTSKQGAWADERFSQNCKEQENARLSRSVGSKNSRSWLHPITACFQEHVELMNVKCV